MPAHKALNPLCAIGDGTELLGSLNASPSHLCAGLLILDLQDPLPDCQRVPPGPGGIDESSEHLRHMLDGSSKWEFAA